MEPRVTGRIASLLSLLLLLAPFAAAQEPGPEQQKLGYFVGTWLLDGEMKPGGKFSGTERNEWLSGGFFVVSHSDAKMSSGSIRGLTVMGYDPDARAYTYHSFNSDGTMQSARGALEGDTWTWLSESKVGEQQAKARYTVKEISSASYTFKFETSLDGGKSWTTIMDGKATRLR